MWAPTAVPGVCGDDRIDPSEECDDDGRARGDGCSEACAIEEFVRFFGTAEGGDVRLTVEGVRIEVATSPGQSANPAAQAIADAINESPALQALEVTASAVGDRMITDGAIDEVLIDDTGLTDLLDLTVQRTRLWWSAVGGANRYDLVLGNLDHLRDSGGDFSAPSVTEGCLGHDRDETY